MNLQQIAQNYSNLSDAFDIQIWGLCEWKIHIP
jgi:hypothetical protein